MILPNCLMVALNLSNQDVHPLQLLSLYHSSCRRTAKNVFALRLHNTTVHPAHSQLDVQLGPLVRLFGTSC